MSAKITTKEITLSDGTVVTVREAEKKDAAALLSYMRKVGGESDFLNFGIEGVGVDVYAEEEAILRTHRAPTSVWIVAEIDGEIIGEVTVEGCTQSRFSHNAQMGVTVAKCFWRRGIGSLLVSEAVSFAKECGFLKNINLSVMADNESAISLYLKHGFAVTGRHEKHCRVGNRFVDVVLMDLMI